MDFVLDPPTGVGPLRIGMARREAALALEQLRDLTDVSPSDEPGRYIFRPSGLMLGIECRHDRLVAVEVGRPHEALDVVRFQDIDVFGLPAREVVTRVGQLTHIEPHVDDPASYVAPDLLLSFWRPFQSDDEPDETQGYFFSAVLLAQPGYYDPPPRAPIG